MNVMTVTVQYTRVSNSDQKTEGGHLPEGRRR